MRICYLAAGRGNLDSHTAGSVHVRSIVSALAELGHSVYLVYAESRGIEELGYAAGVLAIRDPLALRLVYRAADAVWYKLIRAVLAPHFCRGGVGRVLGEPPGMLACMNEVMQIAMNYTIYAQAPCFLERHRPDAIYERACGYNRSGAWLARRFGVPLVVEVNALMSHEEAAYRKAYFPELLSQMEHRTLDEADAIIAVSSYVKQQLVTFGIGDTKIYVLPNGVDVGLFHPDIPGDEARARYNLGSHTVIGFVGHFRVWHGLTLLLRAMRNLVQEYPDVRLLVVGDGPERAALERHIRDWGLEGHAVLTGWLPHSQVPRVLAAIDIGVMPHSNPYGSPMKILEYMSMGKPTVAPRLGPILELITHGEEGFLFEPGNEEELTRALVLLVESKELRMQQGLAAWHKVTSSHTWNHNAQFITEVMRGLLSRRQRVSRQR